MKIRIPVNEYAMQKQLNPSTVYRWIQQGKIETEKTDGLLHVVVDVDEIALKNVNNHESLIAQMQSEIEYLREENRQLRADRQRTDQIIQQMQQDTAEAQQRSDTIVLQFTRQFEEQTKLLEDMRQQEEKKNNGGFFSRFLRRNTTTGG
jgi:hypothetical protein